MVKLPATLLALILSALPNSAIATTTDSIYLTNYTTYPNISLSLTPASFLSVAGSNGSSEISAQVLLAPGTTTKYPLDIAVRDYQNIKKPHFRTTQTLIWLNASSLDASGMKSKGVMEGWSNCLVFFRNVSSVANVAGQGDDGSCGSTLGSECVRDLEGAVRVNVTGGGCGDLVIESLPESCEGRIDVSGSEAWSVANLTYNNQSYYPLLEVQTPLHRWDNSTYLQVAAQTVWPVLWYQSLNQAGIESFNGSCANRTFTGMSCLRTTTKNNGTTSDASILTRTGYSQQWMTVIVLAVWAAWNLS